MFKRLVYLKLLSAATTCNDLIKTGAFWFMEQSEYKVATKLLTLYYNNMREIIELRQALKDLE